MYTFRVLRYLLNLHWCYGAFELYVTCREKTMERLPLCFVLMPFSSEFKNQWDVALKPAIIAAGLSPYRGDEESLGTNIIMRDVTKSIFESHVIVADLTGRNPNVMYELGLAHAAKKQVIMLIQKTIDVPFDVQHIRYLKYDPLDLLKLHTDLIDRLQSTLQALPVDLFPELRLLRKEDVEELAYLRQKSVSVEVVVHPHTADIFLNDKLVGTSPQMLHINPDVPNNTLSVAAVEHFEYYNELQSADIRPGKVIELHLDPREMTSIEKRVPKWLRFRRKHPNSPVLMHAISQYLCRINEIEDAFAEAQELLAITPNWYMARVPDEG
jgi:hypothetical protein